MGMATFHLVIEPPSGGRYEHRLALGSYVIGRAEGSCDIPILSPEISRQHVRLTLTETQCTVEDLGSTSGTMHQGQAVRGSKTVVYPLELHLGTVRVQIEAVTQTAEQSGSAGHYTKGRAIAQGGMGAVLEANDQLLGRTVAMKVVRQDIGDSESIRLRFIREATVLARLEHPSIVPIYEMGKDTEGRLYYTMKKVEGRTLQVILDDLKAGQAATVKEYTLDRLLNVFRKICEAMAFAHDKGVIHRDLKPENVMVGEYGEVLVMDWGLAKILQDAAQSAVELQMSNQTPGSASGTQLPTGFQELRDSQLSGSSQNLTMDGAVMGSPQYMPPEQAEGKVAEVDERSDIFSLGGILYSILTLKPPVEGRTIKEVLDNVKSGRITPPTHYNTGSSSANNTKLPKGNVKDPKPITPLPHCPGGRVPSALSSVTMKALAFAPEDRYAEVEELADDVEAYQRGFATSAENLSLLGQLGLLVKRHKGIAVSVGVAVLLITGLALWFVLNLQAKEKRATEAEKSAIEMLAEVSSQRDAKDQARKDAEAIATFLTEVFQSPDPARNGRTITVAETLDTAAKKLESSLTDQPERRAALQSTLAGTYTALGLYKEALSLQKRVLDYYITRFGREHPNTLSAMHHLAQSTYFAGHWDEALKMREAVFALQRKVLGPEDPDTLTTMHHLAFSYHKADLGKKAIAMFEEVLPLRRKVLGPEHPDTLTTMHFLADVYQRNGRRVEGFRLFEQALAGRRKVLGPEHPDTLMTMHYLALTHLGFWDPSLGPPGDGRKMLQDVLALRRKVLGPEHPDTLMTMHYLSNKLANPDETLAMREGVLAARRKVLGSEHPDTLNSLVNLGTSLQAAGRWAEAIKLQEEAVTLACKLYGLKHNSTAAVMRLLKDSYVAMGDTAKANAILPELIKATAQPFWADHATNSQVARLYEAGLKPSDLEKQPDGTWSMYLGRVRNFKDLSVLRLAPSISKLDLSLTAVTNLTPLATLPLRELSLNDTPVKDLTPLRGMPLTLLGLSGCTNLTDLSPLKDCRKITMLTLPPNAGDIEFLRSLPQLKRLGYEPDPLDTSRPNKTAAEFWKEYDARNKRP
jgi:serine/threonine protein kinase/tetratricopeptide (TPR) repeat protein